MYDSDIGRWMTPDPMNQHFSPYMAMGNDPVGSTDATGGEDDPDYLGGGVIYTLEDVTVGKSSSNPYTGSPNYAGPGSGNGYSGTGPYKYTPSKSSDPAAQTYANQQAQQQAYQQVNPQQGASQQQTTAASQAAMVQGSNIAQGSNSGNASVNNDSGGNEVMELETVDANGTKDLSNYIGRLFDPSSNYGTSLEGGNIGHTLSSFWDSFVKNYSGIFDGNSNNTQANGVRFYSSSSNGTMAANVVDAPLGNSDSYIEDASIGFPTSGRNFSTKLGQFVASKDVALDVNDAFQRGWPLAGKAVGLFDAEPSIIKTDTFDIGIRITSYRNIYSNGDTTNGMVPTRPH
jgi:hypothetical protein